MSIIRFLHLPHLRIHNANALSSPFTIGFPAMTAWLGFVHALQRKLNQRGFTDLELISTAIVSHSCDLQTYKGEGDYVASIVGTGNPLEPKSEKDKPDGYAVRPSFIEEARCHLDVSLLIEYQSQPSEEERFMEPAFITELSQLISTMKIAGGDIIRFDKPETCTVDDMDEREARKLIRSLMPGYVLIERRDLMEDAMKDGADALNAMLGYLTINHTCEKTENDQIIWRSQRKVPGWIIPIAIGFHGISELGQAKNQRDSTVLHCFAESVVTLGEFVMAHRIRQLDDMLWQYQYDAENNLYLCQQYNRN